MALAQIFRFVYINLRFRQFVFPGSKNYWEKRYSLGGNSGQGSYGKSAEFKSEILNKFVRENCISSVTEYGCGDGNQLTYAEYPQYIGLDISEQAVALSSDMFSEDSSKLHPDKYEEYYTFGRLSS